MKRLSFVALFFILLLFFSCKTVPDEIPEEETIQSTEQSSPIEENAVSETLPDDEIASIAVPPDESVIDNMQSDLPEPNSTFFTDDSFLADEPASIVTPPEEYQSETMQIDIPEPSEAIIEFPIKNDDMLPEVPIVPSDDELSGSESSEENQSSEQEQIPEPPAFLRPAEPIEDDTIIREAIPVPVNPIPELPARPSEEDNSIVFSRTVRASVGQMIEIPFRGSGWVFLGEIGSRRGISYDSRRMDPEGQSFIFRAEQPGTYILKFYKEDYIRDYILNDHVQVIIEEAPEPSGTGWFNPPSNWSVVIAEPRWPLESENPQGIDNSSQSSSPQNVPVNTEAQTNLPETEMQNEETDSRNQALSPDSSDKNDPEAASVILPDNAAPNEYIQKAQAEFDAGRVAQAISILEQFRQRFPSGSDEAFWFLGQFYEANSPSRDIRTSLDYYRRLTEEYPQSRRYADAKARIAYLERFYLNIR
jgi:hypothetical protein